MFAEQDQQKSLRSQNEAGDAQAAHGDRDKMRGEMASEAGQVGGGGKEYRAQRVRAEQEDAEEKADCGNSRGEESAALDRERREHEDIEQVRKEKVPDEDRDRSDGYEGIHDIEIVVATCDQKGRPPGK